MISTSHNGDGATFAVTRCLYYAPVFSETLSIKKFSYLLPVQYNITFSVRFFCPRAISKLGDYTPPPGHIFFIIIFVLDIPAVSILEYPN